MKTTKTRSGHTLYVTRRAVWYTSDQEGLGEMAWDEIEEALGALSGRSVYRVDSQGRYHPVNPISQLKSEAQS